MSDQDAAGKHQMWTGEYVFGAPCPICGDEVDYAGAVTMVATGAVVAFMLQPCRHLVQGMWLAKGRAP